MIKLASKKSLSIRTVPTWIWQPPGLIRTHILSAKSRTHQQKQQHIPPNNHPDGQDASNLRPKKYYPIWIQIHMLVFRQRAVEAAASLIFHFFRLQTSFRCLLAPLRCDSDRCGLSKLGQEIGSRGCFALKDRGEKRNDVLMVYHLVAFNCMI